jgi:hypothetical protein
MFVGKVAGLSLPERAAHLDEQAIILDHWRGAFDALDALRVLSVGIGLRCDAEAASPGDQPRTRQALTQLFWAAHLIASEVLTLLRHGYAAGAFARWRALYEIDVRAAVIASGDDDLAGAFLDHEALRHLREERRWWRDVDPDGMGDAEIDAARMSDDWERGLLERHGRSFTTEYGWAHAHLRQNYGSYAKHVAKQRRSNGPTLTDLSRSVARGTPDLAEREIYYMRASAAIHGSPRSLGEFDNTGALRISSGPTIANLGLAIDQTSDDLAQLTNVYMSPMFDQDSSGTPDLLNLCVWRLCALCKSRAFETHQHLAGSEEP